MYHISHGFVKAKTIKIKNVKNSKSSNFSITSDFTYFCNIFCSRKLLKLGRCYGHYQGFYYKKKKIGPKEFIKVIKFQILSSGDTPGCPQVRQDKHYKIKNRPKLKITKFHYTTNIRFYLIFHFFFFEKIVEIWKVLRKL